MIPRLLAVFLLLSSASVWGGEDTSSAEKNGLKIEIKCVEKVVDLTKPLAVEITLTNTSDKDMKLLGIKNGLSLTVHSADGKTYKEAAKANRAMTTGFYMPVIKAGESRVEVRKIKLDNLNETRPKELKALLKANQTVQLEAGTHAIGVQSYFRAFPGNSEQMKEQMYVGSPGYVKTSFTLKAAK